MSLGISGLSTDDRIELESFLGVSFSSISSIDVFMNTKIDILESLWIYQALKERQFDSWFYNLRRIHIQEV
jgi:hypothetical protein